MLNFFQKYHRQINLGLLALFGLCCGILISTLLGTFMLPVTDIEPADLPSAELQTVGTTSSDLNRILQRNIFDPSGRSATSFELGDQNGEQAAATTATVPRNLQLLGTAVAAEKSLALLSVDNEPATYGLEEELPGGGRVEEIRRNLVKIRNPDQTLTTLQILEEPSSPAPAAATEEASRGTTGDDVRKVGENQWVISSETAERSRQNLAQELRLAQMQPRIVEGQTQGFFIRSINPRSVLNKLGLQRGDVILSVNDMALDSPEKALQIFQQLREARRIDVAVERRGEVTNFSYELD